MLASHRGNPMAAIAREVCEGLERVRVVVDIDADDQLFAVGGRPAELPVVAPRSAAQIQYTSGTTGFPKGAVLSHHNLVNNAGLFAERALINRDSVCANFMPLFHTAGCASITFRTAAGSNTLKSNNVEADCKQPSVFMPQPAVWNIGMKCAQTAAFGWFARAA